MSKPIRWPIIRHIRWLYLTYQVNKHYEYWLSLGYLPTNAARDYEYLDKIWNGEA